MMVQVRLLGASLMLCDVNLASCLALEQTLKEHQAAGCKSLTHGGIPAPTAALDPSTLADVCVAFPLPTCPASTTQVKPIAVADMLSLAKGGMAAPQDASGVTPAVQNFLNSVISMTGCARLMLELASRGTYPSWRQWAICMEPQLMHVVV